MLPCCIHRDRFAASRRPCAALPSRRSAHSTVPAGADRHGAAHHGGADAAVLGQPIVIENVGGGRLDRGRARAARRPRLHIDIGQWDTHVGRIIYKSTRN